MSHESETDKIISKIKIHRTFQIHHNYHIVTLGP